MFSRSCIRRLQYSPGFSSDPKRRLDPVLLDGLVQAPERRLIFAVDLRSRIPRHRSDDHAERVERIVRHLAIADRNLDHVAKRIRVLRDSEATQSDIGSRHRGFRTGDRPGTRSTSRSVSATTRGPAGTAAAIHGPGARGSADNEPRGEDSPELARGERRVHAALQSYIRATRARSFLLLWICPPGSAASVDTHRDGSTRSLPRRQMTEIAP